jgi:hypothetical protein
VTGCRNQIGKWATYYLQAKQADDHHLLVLCSLTFRMSSVVKISGASRPPNWMDTQFAVVPTTVPLSHKRLVTGIPVALPDVCTFDGFARKLSSAMLLVRKCPYRETTANVCVRSIRAIR